MEKFSRGRSDSGLVADVSKSRWAMALSHMKCGKVFMPVGVLLGSSNLEMLAGFPIYSEHVVSITAAKTATENTRRPTRSTAAPLANQAYMDRLGYHTFRQGDIVTYHRKSDAEQSIREIVYGVQVYYYPNNSRSQQHRNLITFSPELKDFSILPWTSWHRIPYNPDGAGLDLDEVYCQTWPDAMQVSEMLKLWPDSKLRQDASTHDKIKKLAALGPAQPRQDNYKKS